MCLHNTWTVHNMVGEESQQATVTFYSEGWILIVIGCRRSFCGSVSNVQLWSWNFRCYSGERSWRVYCGWKPKQKYDLIQTLWKTIDIVGDNVLQSNTNLGHCCIQTVSLGNITLHFPLSQYLSEGRIHVSIKETTVIERFGGKQCNTLFI